jgi:hypothetical protein
VGAVFLVPRDTRGTLSLGSDTVPVGVEGGGFEFQGVTPGTYDIIARLTADMRHRSPERPLSSFPLKTAGRTAPSTRPFRAMPKATS